MKTIQAAGTVWAVFGHRFAIEGADGRHLADLGPKGAEGVALAAGDRVTIEGERKPSEIKVARLTFADGREVAIAWPDKHAEADPKIATAAAQAAGYDVTGVPERKPKHFEVPAEKDGEAVVLHVELDGTIRKAKPATRQAA